MCSSLFKSNIRSKEKKKGKKKLILISIAAVLIVAVGIGAYVMFLWFTDLVGQFQTAIKDRDFSGAAQLYQEELKDGDAKKLEQAGDFIVSYADEVKKQYIDGEMEYEDALAQLQEMSKLGVVSNEELQPIQSSPTRTR